MAEKTLSFRIGITDDATKAFLKIGEAGEKAGKQVQTAFSGKTLKVDGLTRQFGQLRTSILGIGTAGRTVGAQLAGALAAVSRLRTSLAGLAVGAVGGGLFALAKSAAASVDSIRQQSHALGLTASQFQKLSAVARQAGVSQDELTRILEKFVVQADDAAPPAKALAENIITLGGATSRLGDSTVSIVRGLERTQAALGAAGEKAGNAFDQFIAFAEALGKIGDQAEVLRKLDEKFGAKLAITVANLVAELNENLRETGKLTGNLAPEIDPADIAALKQFGDELGRVEESAERIRNKLGAVAAVRFTPLLAQLADILAGATPAFLKLADFVGAQLRAAIEGPLVIARTLKDALAGIFTDLPEAASQLGAQLSQMFDLLRANAEQAGADLVAFFSTLPAKISAAFAGLGAAIGPAFGEAIDFVKGLFDDLVSFVGGVVDRIVALVSRIASAISSAQSRAGNTQIPPNSTPGLAGGGMVRGPGTATSDSVLARLSTGEFVIRARAVQHYGTDLIAAINRMRLPRDAFRGFSAGGLVSAINRSLEVPRFAAGGLAVGPAPGGGRPLVLQLPGGEMVGGMTASEGAVAQLQRHAAQRVAHKAGAFPSWYSGR